MTLSPKAPRADCLGETAHPRLTQYSQSTDPAHGNGAGSLEKRAQTGLGELAAAPFRASGEQELAEELPTAVRLSASKIIKCNC